MAKIENYLEDHVELLWKDKKLRERFTRFDQNETNIEIILKQNKIAF